MNKDEVILLLEEHNLEWNNFLHHMSGKKMEITVEYGIVFPKKEVNSFINKNNYYD